MVEMFHVFTRLSPADRNLCADFGLMSEAPLFLTDVMHAANVDVDEEGTVADGCAPPEPKPPFTMVVDRPFLFAIMDGWTCTRLFMGTEIS
jgi:serpin B